MGETNFSLVYEWFSNRSDSLQSSFASQNSADNPHKEASMFHFLKMFRHYTEYLYPYLIIYLFPVAHIAQTGSVYFTLVVTIERYFAVCRPLQSHSSAFLATWKRGICISIFIFLFSIGFTIPRWMEYKIMVHQDKRNKVDISTTALKENPQFFKFYIHYAYFIVIFAIPFLILIVFNLVIYKQIQKANRIRQELSILQTSEIKLALMLVCVVVVFLLCNVIPVVNNLMEFCCDNSRILVFLGNFLVALNSSINFLIYYSFGEVLLFKDTLKTTVLVNVHVYYCTNANSS
ncbi:unnamed protein product [Allacma fusca]|uniref:G-protein coupled receptors family 1 profile domain-containing protein n=1 Tax=Allacma fusca TaxID=39272 RepID=A0A8J2JYP6_9HEXA|nr:unnamed protein product [Allacma fusca]